MPLPPELKPLSESDFSVDAARHLLNRAGFGGTPEQVQALNSLGATPRDLIAIFTALKAAGALNAELVVM